MGPHGNRPAPRRFPVTYGEAELRPDAARPYGWTLLVNGVPQSYVDLADPEHLEFPYMRRLGRVLRLWTPGCVRPRVLHLGGGGLTLARLLHHTRPEIAQRVVERDPALLALVSRLGWHGYSAAGEAQPGWHGFSAAGEAQLPPFPPGIEVEVGDARAVLEGAPPREYDLIIADVFDGAAMPVSVGSAGFAAAAARALRPDGLLAMNLTDVPPLAHSRVQVATAATAFAGVALLGDAAVLRGRRAGNVILLAGAVPMIESHRSERVLRGEALSAFVGGAKPRLDAPA